MIDSRKVVTKLQLTHYLIEFSDLYCDIGLSSSEPVLVLERASIIICSSSTQVCELILVTSRNEETLRLYEGLSVVKSGKLNFTKTF